MVRFLEIGLKENRKDFEAISIIKESKKFLNLEIKDLEVRKLYAFDLEISDKEWGTVKDEFLDSVIEKQVKNHKIDELKYAVKIGFNPGVTDNEGRTAKEMVEDILDKKFPNEQKVYTSKIYLFKDKNITEDDIQHLSKDLLANELIEDIKIFDKNEFKSKKSYEIPKIKSEDKPKVRKYVLKDNDRKLLELSKERLMALNLEEMKAIKNYYDRKEIQEKREKVGLDKKATDAELEMLAQTWSEHCKHKIFSSKIDYFNKEKDQREEIDSIFKTYIVNPTLKLRKETDHLVSVFHDNAGVITFNEDTHICYKVETHNSPSALDPYGGAMTGIVGVNRDILGTGRGAVPHINVWGYCFGNLDTEKEIPDKLMHPKRVREGVHKGVIEGGNQSGIPYGRGWELYDDRYRGKPLVFCGTVGLMPKDLYGKDGSKKWINPNDKVVMIGGRVGKDGIHGATFSSQELSEESPAQAVQIGDPITQKKMTDFLVEARDENLINFIQDNGAGGLASSVGEMAEISNGAYVDLAKVPLKYHGLKPWEILISEAQERMTLAIDPDKIDRFLKLAEKHEVEASVIGEFRDTGYFHAVYENKPVCYIEVNFLHDGVPQLELEAVWEKPEEKEIDYNSDDLKDDFLKLVNSSNLASKESKMRRYDHEVKGLSVVKPLIGVNNDVMSDTSVFGIDYESEEGVVLSEGVNPYYSDIDTYHMTASIIDEAVRKAIVTGADPDHLAGLDNFCWPDPIYDENKNKDGKYKLAQLVRSTKAISDFVKEYHVPCISGKDSMKNDAVINGEKISIPPTLLFSVIGKINDYKKAITPEFKNSNDLIFICGETLNELGQSEYYRMKDIEGGKLPRVNLDISKKIYKSYHKAYKKNLINSAHSPHKGGIAYSLALQTLASDKGVNLDLAKVPTGKKDLTITEILFSESNSRIIFTVSPENKEKVKEIFEGLPVSQIGKVSFNKKIDLKLGQDNFMNINIDNLRKKYREKVNEEE